MFRSASLQNVRNQIPANPSLLTSDGLVNPFLVPIPDKSHFYSIHLVCNSFPGLLLCFVIHKFLHKSGRLHVVPYMPIYLYSKIKYSGITGETWQTYLENLPIILRNQK